MAFCFGLVVDRPLVELEYAVSGLDVGNSAHLTIFFGEGQLGNISMVFPDEHHICMDSHLVIYRSARY